MKRKEKEERNYIIGVASYVILFIVIEVLIIARAVLSGRPQGYEGEIVVVGTVMTIASIPYKIYLRKITGYSPQ